jgi:ComEC/Rec2-related protein
VEIQPIQAAAYALRQGVIRQMRLGLSPEHAAVMEGLLLGARGDLHEDLNDAFERTGAAHLLATAGLHVGLLAWLLLGLMRRLRLPRRPALLAVFALLPLYAIMTGGRPAVIRAVIVAEVVLLGPLLEREPNLPNALSLASLILLLLNPHSLFDAGFQLSFATVITILLLLPPTEAAVRHGCERVTCRWPRAKWLQRGLRIVATSFFLAVIAQIGAAPLVALHYHDLSLIAPLVRRPAAGARESRCGSGRVAAARLARLGGISDSGRVTHLRDRDGARLCRTHVGLSACCCAAIRPHLRLLWPPLGIRLVHITPRRDKPCERRESPGSFAVG